MFIIYLLRNSIRFGIKQSRFKQSYLLLAFYIFGIISMLNTLLLGAFGLKETIAMNGSIKQITEEL